jgi:arabinan endo-1,5-alpha-L-arabinosidase
MRSIMGNVKKSKMNSAARMYGVIMVVLLIAFVGCKKEVVQLTEQPLTVEEDIAMEEKIIDQPLVVEKIKMGSLNAGASVHDPSVIKGENGTYYIFGSHMAAAKTTDLRKFKTFAEGVSSSNPLFDNLFTDFKAFDYVGKNTDGGHSVWAPDVVYNKLMDKYVMYFCTTSTFIKSNICMATADSIEGPYTFQGTLIYSGFTPYTIEQTDVLEYVSKEEASRYYAGNDYNNQNWPNAIDPNVFYDETGRMWMTYGSWSGGIFILEIDEATGLPIHPEEGEGVDIYFGKHLLGGRHQSIEAPYVLYDKGSDYYYLFVSYGSLVREGGYQIRLFRSKNPDGPYTDMKGQTLEGIGNQNGYGVKLMGNYRLPSLLRAYMAPGHNSAMVDEDGKLLLVYHTRFEGTTEGHEPRVHQMFKNQDDWLVVAPYAYAGEAVLETGYPQERIIGTYYVVNHSTDISKTIQEPVKVNFLDDGRIVSIPEVTGKKQMDLGTWSIVDNTSYINVEMMDSLFKGVVLEMEDEGGTLVMTFTAVSDDNKSLWGVNNSGYLPIQE